MDVILPRHHRSAYARFQSGVAPLRLETGRYERIEERDRVRFNCDSQIETEEHVLTVCPFLNKTDSKFFGNQCVYRCLKWSH